MPGLCSLIFFQYWERREQQERVRLFPFSQTWEKGSGDEGFLPITHDRGGARATPIVSVQVAAEYTFVLWCEPALWQPSVALPRQLAMFTGRSSLTRPAVPELRMADHE
jgi:hypothetical protein